jgi:hypothetical protein
MHRMHRQHDGEVELRLAFPFGETQPQFTTPTDDITKHLIDGELVLASETRDLLTNLPSVATQKRGGGLVVSVAGRVAEDLQKVSIVLRAEPRAVVLLPSLVVAPQSVSE